MGFENDILISYAHIDEITVDKNIEGWISKFDETLQAYVTSKWGHKPVIWRDDRLQGNDFFTPEILSQFPKLKLLVSIITPRYLESEWCKAEVETFFEAAQQTGGISIENKARIFKILKTPVELEQQPEKIRGILGYQFYKEDPTSKRIKEFKLEFGKEFEDLFYQTVDDVAQDIVLLLKRLSNPASSTTVSKGKIYLADTSEDLKEYRDTIKRELEDEGYTVFPNRILTLVFDKFESEVEGFMKDCSLSIHLAATEDYGIVPGKTEKSIIVLQHEIAARLSSTQNLSQLIWIAPASSTLQNGNTSQQDTRLVNFLNQLRHGEQLHHDSDLLEGTIEEFKQAIKDTLQKMEEKRLALEKEKENEKQKAALAAQVTQSTPVDEGPKTIYLISDQRDMDDIKVIDDFLYDLGFNTWPSVFEGTPEELATAHEDSLRDCDAVLIYYGNANEAWLRTKISELKRKTPLSGAKPLISSMVYVGGPTNAQKAGYRTRDVNIVGKGLSGFDKESINAFVEKLKQQ